MDWYGLWCCNHLKGHLINTAGVTYCSAIDNQTAILTSLYQKSLLQVLDGNVYLWFVARLNAGILAFHEVHCSSTNTSLDHTCKTLRS